MGYGVAGLPYNIDAMMESWQDVVVAVVAIVVGILVVRRVWRFFVCGDSCSCSDCSKECAHRKGEKS
jgi:hypothetical protein